MVRFGRASCDVAPQQSGQQSEAPANSKTAKIDSIPIKQLPRQIPRGFSSMNSIRSAPARPFRCSTPFLRRSTPDRILFIIGQLPKTAFRDLVPLMATMPSSRRDVEITEANRSTRPCGVREWALAASVTVERGVLTQRGQRLEYFTIAWNSIEAIAALVSGILAGSVALVGFGPRQRNRGN
jgi:hypothetical protein